MSIRSWLVSFICLILFFFICNRVFVYSPTILETAASYVMHPVLVVQRTWIEPIKQWQRNRATIQELNQRIAALTTQRDAFLAQALELKVSYSYLEHVKEFVDFKSRYATDAAVLASVLLRHIADDAHYLYVDAGSIQGVELDMVAVYNNVLLGRVTEVFPQYSKVVLVTDRSCKVAAVCVGSNVHGIYEGGNAPDSSRLTHVSHLLELQDQDLVISSGEGLIFPQGFGLGTITHHERVGMYHDVSLQPLIDVRGCDYCYLIKKAFMAEQNAS